jgi:hypothetical protein
VLLAKIPLNADCMLEGQLTLVSSLKACVVPMITPFHIDSNAGSLMMNSAFLSCWLHSRLPPSHPSVLL